ncbi:hypothetical protein GCM10008995_07530 [Halobellus salinus]|uniref:Ig-like domain-containing protein n=1 Tax=Halobellus salinus TaxID=931585 RepID=A0A830EN23_9EURY|nr:hypothetical protein [Halobellus salinus]GGJ00183.1 hypothetical protein GCM10008995_07530 [Halobellus salinus]SMP01882.1 hypothetical protein SAMN06265347_101155 [Halobellus salinus]
MAPEQTPRGRTVGRRARDASNSRPAARSEDLHLRSYAHEWAYDVAVEVVSPDGDVAFAADYYLQPGDAESVIDALPAGEYEVRATLDNDTHRTATCRIGADPDRTAVIEVGNGIVSLTEGLPTR